MAGEKGHRFEFGWLEVLGLILVFAAGSTVVFFLGVFVGKGLQESRLAREERVVRLPIDGVHLEPAGSQEQRIASPAARHVKHSRARWNPIDVVDEPRRRLQRLSHSRVRQT